MTAAASGPLIDILYRARLQLGRKRFGGDGALALQLIADLCAEVQRRDHFRENPPKPETNYHCSFCGKSQHKVQKLIAGPSTFICNECVGICDIIIAEGSEP